MRGRGVWRIAVGVALLWLGSCLVALAAAAQPLVVDMAEVQVQTGGKTLDLPAARLPLDWDRQFGAADGQARVRFTVAVQDPRVPLALYFARIGNTYAVRVNGQEVARFGDPPADRYADAAHAPRYVEIAPHFLRPVNSIEIQLGALGGRSAGLAPIVAGTRAQVRPLHASAYRWQVGGARIVAVVSMVLGLLSLLLWLRQREAAYLYYGLGEVLWSVQTSRVLLEDAPLPWPLWGLVPQAAFNLATPLLLKFALTVMGYRQGWVVRMVNTLIVLAVPAAVLTVQGGVVQLGPLWQMAVVLLSVAVATALARSAAEGQLWEARVLALALGLVVAAAVRDVVAIRLSADTYAMVPWTRFTWVGFGIALAWTIAERMRRDKAAVASMNATLSRQLAERDAQLQAAFERERANEKQLGADEERQRLMRDLHDGLGGQLVGALRVAQREGSTKEEVTEQLREAIDQLKVTVDAMQETDGDIATALGTVRYRLAPRLQAAGIQLHWAVPRRLPLRPGWGPRQSYQLQMILVEAFTNMMAHAGATAASLKAFDVAAGAGRRVDIEVRDNGRGYDVASALANPGKGLGNMHVRAQAIGAQLHIESRAGETLVRIALPATEAT